MDNQFNIQDLDYTNTVDATIWLNNGKLIGLIDEDKGGIIAYIHEEHAQRIKDLLNSTKPNQFVLVHITDGVVEHFAGNTDTVKVIVTEQDDNGDEQQVVHKCEGTELLQFDSPMDFFREERPSYLPTDVRVNFMKFLS